MFRTALARSSVAHVRPFHSSLAARKTVTEKVSEVASSVNKKLGNGLASAIKTGEQATQATKETLKSTTEEGKKKAGEAASVAGQKKNEASSSMRQTKEDLQKKASK
ncbi:hypothetical protein B0H10DRAFT_1997075 [Mycena sp. CBHHK59/15]|nr:hypothetical protein B0H10DRAFT_1997075 [Mycena sp. CBHHK59/15]